MKRLIIVYNSRSSKAEAVRREVIAPARKLGGFLVGKYEVLPTDVDDNARKLAGILEDDDFVIAAGGDATASVALNGCMLSGREVTFGVLPFGNFNDTARTLGKMDFSEIIEKFSRGQTKDFYPLRVVVDGEDFRYAAGYVSVGMMAESVEIFNSRKNRKKLRAGKSKVFSYFLLAKWYFSHRKKQYLPDGATDYFAVNGRRIGGIMRGGYFCFSRKFLNGRFYLRNVFSLFWFMARAIFSGIPGEEKKEDVLEFDKKTSVTVQIEGESKEFECQEIRVFKDRNLKVVCR